MYVSRKVRLVQHTATDTVPHNVNQSVTNNRSSGLLANIPRAAAVENRELRGDA